MKQNIGTINALIRITLGLVLFGCSATKLVRKPWCTWSNILLWIGAMKVAEELFVSVLLLKCGNSENT